MGDDGTPARARVMRMMFMVCKKCLALKREIEEQKKDMAHWKQNVLIAQAEAGFSVDDFVKQTRMIDKWKRLYLTMQKRADRLEGRLNRLKARYQYWKKQRETRWRGELPVF